MGLESLGYSSEQLALLSDEELVKLSELIEAKEEDLRLERATDNLLHFSEYIEPEFDYTGFYEVYYTVLDLFAKGIIKRLIVSVPPQTGKFLKWDTAVLTTKGWKNHCDLVVGDYVFGNDGLPKKVLWNSGVYEMPTVNFNLVGNESIVCAKEHEWLLEIERDDKKGRISEVHETQNIFKQKNRRSPAIRIPSPIQMPEKELPIDPYVLGVWLGDGSKSSGVITEGAQDTEHFSFLGNVAKQTNGCSNIRIEGLTKKLRMLDVLENKHIPIDYLLASEEQRFELLRGLMDTDGYSDKRGRCEISQKIERLASEIDTLIRSLGMKPSLIINDAKIYGRYISKRHRVSFNPPKGVKIFNLKRKQDVLENKICGERNDKTRYFVDSITENKNELGNCIQVEGEIYLVTKSLIPTHNSHGSTRKLPAYMLGKNPNLRMAIGSYSADLSKDFNSDIQKIIDSPEYHKIFPNTMLSGSPFDKEGVKGYSRTREQFEVLKKKGILYSVGRGGGLTGKTIDLSILDDLYKNYEEANSPIVREEAINFYKSVIRTRNPKQELIVFTRWHENDLIGFIEEKETVVTINSLSDIYNIPERAWIKINFEALKDSEPTEIDPREYGEPLTPERHSKERLEEEKKLDKENFECLYQGNPLNKEGLMYGEFGTYPSLPQLRIIKSETDTADKGTDYFLSVVYGLPLDWNDNYVYVLDVMYTQEPMEITEPKFINFTNRWRVNEADIESNNGGRGFSRAIEKDVCAVVNQWYQSSNKESRIFSNRAKVNREILFPVGWENTFDKFHSHLTKFKKFFKANKNDEVADVLTSIIERKDEGFRVEDIEIDNY